MTDDVTSLYIHADDYPAEMSWRLVKWCQQHGSDEWTVIRHSGKWIQDNQIEHFDSIMNFFYIGQAKRRKLSARHKTFLLQTTDLWKLSSSSLIALQEFMHDGLFTYPIGTLPWIEDPAIYRQGELMLSVVSHETAGVLRVTEAER